MSLLLQLRRWRRLRGVPELTVKSREGDIVRATGLARALSETDPFVAPVRGVRCVVAWTKYFTAPDPNRGTRSSFFFERMHLRPFALETPGAHLIVDASHVELLFETLIEGRIHEVSVADGQAVTVIGSLLREGIERPRDDVAFRDVVTSYRLVGNRKHPIVIAPPT